MSDNPMKTYGNFRDIFFRIGIITGATSNTKLAKLLGITQSSVAGAKKRDAMPANWILEISKRFGISMDYLVYGFEPMMLEGVRGTDIPMCIEDDDPFWAEYMNPVGGKNIDQNQTVLKKAIDPLDYVFIPLAKTHLSAGNGIPILENYNSSEPLAFRRPWAHRIATGISKLVAFFVEGDSMWPSLQEGDVVLIDQGRTELRAGAIFAVCVGGDLLQIKLLEIIGEKVKIIADNKNLYPAVELDPSEIKILGQVIWYGRELIKRK